MNGAATTGQIHTKVGGPNIRTFEMLQIATWCGAVLGSPKAIQPATVQGPSQPRTKSVMVWASDLLGLHLMNNRWPIMMLLHQADPNHNRGLLVGLTAFDGLVLCRAPPSSVR